jgi:hypothetical protein
VGSGRMAKEAAVANFWRPGATKGRSRRSGRGLTPFLDASPNGLPARAAQIRALYEWPTIRPLVQVNTTPSREDISAVAGKCQQRAK